MADARRGNDSVFRRACTKFQRSRPADIRRLFHPEPEGRASTHRLAGMNSKHEYVSFKRLGRGEYLPVIGEETWEGGPRAINHIVARLRDVSHRRVGTLEIF